MKFCMVTTFYPPFNFGGDGIYVEALSRELVQRGHEVTVVHCLDAFRLVSGRHVDAPKEARIDGVRVIRLHSALGPLSPLLTQQTGHPVLKHRRLAETLAGGFDVVNFHNISLVGGPGVLALPAAGAIKLYTLHEHWLLCSTHIFWKNRERACDRRQCLSCCLRSGIPPQAWRATGLVARSLRQVDALIAPSEYTANLHREAALPVPIVVNPLFSRLAPTASSPAAATREHGEFFLFVGRVTASKGVRPLLLQFAAHPRFELRVAGSGDALAALQLEFGGCANIRFLGAVDSAGLETLYAAATAVILSSLAPETFGLTVVEGMAFGTPALVHDAGGSGEVVEASGAGHVFRDFSELPALLARLSDDGAHWRDLSRRAREAATTSYSAERHLGRYLDLVAGLRAKPAASAAA
jgi:glycosyltransferase involved in cell wall biosynthesis